jgi:excisionase family DNA binding protein
MKVKEAALFLGVSAQTVYLWVERKQIPHHRDREGQRRGINQYRRLAGSAEAVARAASGQGQQHSGSHPKGRGVNRDPMGGFFLENFSKPPIRIEKTHLCYSRVGNHVKTAVGRRQLVDLPAQEIEAYLRCRLNQRVRVRRKTGIVEKARVKPAIVHQEYRVLRRMLNVAVRKKLLVANPCDWCRISGARERPVPPALHDVDGAAEGRSAGARLPVQRDSDHQRDGSLGLQRARSDEERAYRSGKRVVWIPDSKTPDGVGEVPLTDVTIKAFRDQISIAGPGPYLFPNDEGSLGYPASFKKVWETTLRKAGVAHFRLYDLRSTYATRLSAGGVADEWVTQFSGRATRRCSRSTRR